MKIPSISNKAKNIVAIVGLGIIVLPFFIGGVCLAWDNYVQHALEASLASNVQATAAVKKACNDSYDALLKYKQEAKIAIQGTGNPCEGF